MKLFRIKDAAEVLGLKTQSLRQMEKAGIVHPVRDWANHRRFREDEVQALHKRMLSGEDWRESKSTPRRKASQGSRRRASAERV